MNIAETEIVKIRTEQNISHAEARRTYAASNDKRSYANVTRDQVLNSALEKKDIEIAKLKNYALSLKKELHEIKKTLEKPKIIEPNQNEPKHLKPHTSRATASKNNPVQPTKSSLPSTSTNSRSSSSPAIFNSDGQPLNMGPQPRKNNKHQRSSTPTKVQPVIVSDHEISPPSKKQVSIQSGFTSEDDVADDITDVVLHESTWNF